MSRLDMVLREKILPGYNKMENDLIEADTFMDKLNRVRTKPTESELEIWREIFEEDKVKKIAKNFSSSYCMRQEFLCSINHKL